MGAAGDGELEICNGMSPRLDVHWTRTNWLLMSVYADGDMTDWFLACHKRYGKDKTENHLVRHALGVQHSWGFEFTEVG